MLKWAPEPHASVYGLGMNVTMSPTCLAICFAIRRNRVMRSAVMSAGAKSKSNSTCPSPPSWSKLNAPKPHSRMAWTIGPRNSMTSSVASTS